METRAFRPQSIARLAKAGISIPPSLPLIDDFSVRPIGEIVDRILCLNAVAEQLMVSAAKSLLPGFPTNICWGSSRKMSVHSLVQATERQKRSKSRWRGCGL